MTFLQVNALADRMASLRHGILDVDLLAFFVLYEQNHKRIGSVIGSIDSQTKFSVLQNVRS